MAKVINSTVEELSFREFLGYLFMVSALGKSETSHQRGPTSKQEKVGLGFQLLAQEPLKPGRIEYDPKRRVARILRKSLVNIFEGQLAKSTAEGFFAETKTYFERTKQFLGDERFHRWKEEKGKRLKLLGPVQDEDLRAWKKITGQELDGLTPFAGIPVVGYRGEEWIWIGLISPDVFDALCEKNPENSYPSPNDVADYFAPPRVTRAPVRARLSWIDRVASSISFESLAGEDRFPAFCLDLAEAVLGLEGAGTKRLAPGVALLSSGTVSGSPGPSLLVVMQLSSQPQGLSAAIRALQAGKQAFDALVPTSPDWPVDSSPSGALLVMTDLSFDAAGPLLEQVVQHESWLAASQVLVWDGEVLLSLLSHAPWVWSEYFGTGKGLTLVSTDDPIRVRDVMVPPSFAAQVTVPDGITHPAITTCSLGSGSRLQIVGRPGAGKSTALYHLISDAPLRLIFLFAPDCNDDDVDLAKAIISSLAREPQSHWNPAVVLVFDDLHLTVGLPPAKTPLGRLRDVIHRLSDGIAVVVSYSSPDTDRVAASYQTVLSTLGFHEVTSLDCLPPAFGEAVRQVGMAAFGTDARRVSVETEIHLQATPREILNRLYLGRLLAPPDAEFLHYRHAMESFWRSHWEQLAHDGRQDAVAIIDVLSLYWTYGMGRLQIDVVEQLFGHWAKRDSRTFTEALRWLTARGWVRRDDKELFADEVVLSLGRGGESDEWHWPLIEAFAEWLRSEGSTLGADMHQQVVHELVWHVKSCDRCKANATLVRGLQWPLAITMEGEVNSVALLEMIGESNGPWHVTPEVFAREAVALAGRSSEPAAMVGEMVFVCLGSQRFAYARSLLKVSGLLVSRSVRRDLVKDLWRRLEALHGAEECRYRPATYRRRTGCEPPPTNDRILESYRRDAAGAMDWIREISLSLRKRPRRRS